MFVFEKPGILSENLKTLTSSNYPTVNNLTSFAIGFCLIVFFRWVKQQVSCTFD